MCVCVLSYTSNGENMIEQKYYRNGDQSGLLQTMHHYPRYQVDETHSGGLSTC